MRAQATGKVAGTVTDTGGDPLPGATVTVEGTTRGAATRNDGGYELLLRPGTYTLRVRFVGFDDVVAQDVQVRIDKTTRLDVEMREATVAGEEVIVTAERPVVEMDRTTTKSVVDAEQLEALPVATLQEAVELQAGVVDGHFRGGRLTEVAYLVNGVPVNNAFTGGAAFEVEQNMVENLEVISGVFNAEYGQALSGVVNVVTKDVPDRWEGTYLGFLGAVASTRELEFTRRTAPAGRDLTIADFESERVSYSEATPFPNLIDQQVSVGGPILADRFGVRLTARYYRSEGSSLARRLFAPSDSSGRFTGSGAFVLGVSGGDPETWVLQSTGDQAFVPLDGGYRYSVNGNAIAKLTEALQLDYNVFIQQGEGHDYRHAFKYNPEGINTNRGFTQTHIAALRYLLGTNSFANLSYSYLRDRGESFLYEDPTDPRYVPSQLASQTGAYAFALGGNDLGRSESLTQTHTVVGSFESQVTPVHLLKTGFQFRYHDLDNRSFETLVDEGGTGTVEPRINPSRFSDDRLLANPYEFAVYVQDKIELRNLIVNAGLRFDYFEPDYQIPKDWSQADSVYLSVAPGDSLFNRQPADPSYQVSPRLGIAFPISATGVLRASAGLFFQTPRFSLLYQNPEYEPDGLFGNPSLDPERTISFEMGFQQGLTNSLGLEVTAYSKDIRNLTGTDVLRNPRGDFVTRYFNVDVGTVRGVTFSLFQRPTRTSPLAWTVDYTLQFAEGTSSDPGQSFIRNASGEREEVRLNRLDWDRRHVLNNTLTYRPVDALRVTLINTLESGRPYTSVREFIESTVPNDQDRPTIFNTDLRVFYALPFFNAAEAFFQVDNLFDTEAATNVYRDTGLATQSVEQELFRSTGAIIRGINSLDEFFFRTRNLTAPRRVSLGLKVAL